MAINIEDTSKSTFVPDLNLNEPIPMDLASTQAKVLGITTQVASLVEQQKQAQDLATKTTPTAPKPEPTTLAGKILGKVEKPVPLTPIEQAAKWKETQSAFLEASGITPEITAQGQKVVGEIQGLNAQLDSLAQQEQAEKLQATAGFGLSTRKGAVESEITRRYAIQKSSIAAEMAIKLGEYAISQGRVDEAKKEFQSAITFMTAKERQEVEDYRWALSFYSDLDKEERNILQQKFDNSIKTEQLAIQKAQLRIQQSQAGATDSQFSKDGQAAYEQFIETDDWGSAWNMLKAKYPNKTNTEIDAAMGKVAEGTSIGQTATNPATGEQVEWDGSNWVPIGGTTVTAQPARVYTASDYKDTGLDNDTVYTPEGNIIPNSQISSDLAKYKAKEETFVKQASKSGQQSPGSSMWSYIKNLFTGKGNLESRGITRTK